jgi:hypothetical protein
MTFCIDDVLLSMSFLFLQLSDDLGKDDDDDEVDAADLADDHPFKKFERRTQFKLFILHFS